MRRHRGGWRWAAGFAAALAAAGCSAMPGGTGNPSAATSPAGPSASSPPPSTAVTGQDSARFAAPVRTRAQEAGVDAQLVMAILYNESYKPHDPAAERAWQRIKPDASFGVANMHQATFDQTKRGRGFASRDWHELPDDPDLAIEAAAWYLHDLAKTLPAQRSAAFTVEELLALGYNTGPGNMKLFARGTKLGPQAQSYLDDLRRNWAKAGDAVSHG